MFGDTFSHPQAPLPVILLKGLYQDRPWVGSYSCRFLDGWRRAWLGEKAHCLIQVGIEENLQNLPILLSRNLQHPHRVRQMLELREELGKEVSSPPEVEKSL